MGADIIQIRQGEFQVNVARPAMVYVGAEASQMTEEHPSD
jgi:hypothetical protein